GNVCFEPRALLVEKEIFRYEQCKVGAFCHLNTDILENLRQRNTLPAAQRNRAKLATAPAPARDLHRAERGAMAHWRNPGEHWTVAFNGARQRFAAYGCLK